MDANLNLANKNREVIPGYAYPIEMITRLIPPYNNVITPQVTASNVIPVTEWRNIHVDPHIDLKTEGIQIRSVISDINLPLNFNTRIDQVDGGPLTYNITSAQAGLLSQYCKGLERFNHHRIRLRVPPPAYAVELPTSRLLCLEELYTLRKVLLEQTDMFGVADNPSFLLAYFAGLKGFAQEYTFYMENPDTGVTFSTHNRDALSETLENLQAKLPLLGPDARKHTRSLHIAIMHLIAITSEKQLIDENHRRKFLTERLYSLAIFEHTPNILYSNLGQYLPLTALNSGNTALAFLPRLKTRLFSLILHNRSEHFLEHTRSLLAYSGMTSTHLIHDMLFSNIKCAGFRNFTILSELKLFFEAYKKAYEKYHKSIVYMRLIGPNETILNATQWPNLAALAFYFNMRHHSKNLAKFKFSERGVTVSNISQLALASTRENYIDPQNMMRKLGLNPNMFVDNVTRLDLLDLGLTDMDRTSMEAVENTQKLEDYLNTEIMRIRRRFEPNRQTYRN